MGPAPRQPQDDERTGPMPTPPLRSAIRDAMHRRVGADAPTLLHALWLPAVILAVVGLVGYGVSAVRQESDLITAPPADNSVPATVVQVNPKDITYEVFGDLGSGGKVRYATVNSEPVEVALAALPWSHAETTTAPSASLSLVTQVSGDAVGCRILVNGVVRDEQSVRHGNAAAACTVTAA